MGRAGCSPGLPVACSTLLGCNTTCQRGYVIYIFTGGPKPTWAWQRLSRDDADDKFAKLSQNGQVTMLMQDTFWGSYFGSLTDQFGIN